DLYAGSGALGLEALSRGAAFVDFVELAPASLRAIRENAAMLGALPQLRIHRAEALRFAQKLPAGAYDVAFADPPYNLGMAPRLAAQWLRVPFAHVLGIGHDAHEALPEGGEARGYGGTAVTLYRAPATAACRYAVPQAMAPPPSRPSSRRIACWCGAGAPTMRHVSCRCSRPMSPDSWGVSPPRLPRRRPSPNSPSD